MLCFLLGLTTTYNKKVEFRNSLKPRDLGRPANLTFPPLQKNVKAGQPPALIFLGACSRRGKMDRRPPMSRGLAAGQ